jgi:muramidase (phage lysozyme)
MSETQLVDINGAIIALTAQNGNNVSVFSRYDTNGVQSTINAGDVTAVVQRLGQATVSPCGTNYQYNTNLVQSTINAGDVTAVVGKLGQTTTAACVN